jgi:hypothetical protein
MEKRMDRIGEFEHVTSRGKTIVMTVWERPCSVCGDHVKAWGEYRWTHEEEVAWENG